MRDDAAVWRLAGDQQLLITFEELVQHGFTRSAIRHRVATRRLFRIFPLVFALGDPAMPPERLAMAAALACGPDAGGARRTAAKRHRLTEEPWPTVPQISVPRQSWTRGPGGVDLVPSRTLLPEEVETVDGVRATTVLRTIADNAAIENDRGIRAMIRHAQREHRLDLDELFAYAAVRPPTSVPYARIRRVLARYVERSALTDSDREALVLELCATAGLPLPDTQVWIAGFRVDFVWRSLGLILELDDRWSHDNPISFVEDRARDRALLAAGFQVIHVTVAELLRNPRRIARDIRGALRVMSRHTARP